MFLSAASLGFFLILDSSRRLGGPGLEGYIWVSVSESSVLAMFLTVIGALTNLMMMMMMMMMTKAIKWLYVLCQIRTNK